MGDNEMSSNGKLSERTGGAENDKTPTKRMKMTSGDSGGIRSLKRSNKVVPSKGCCSYEDHKFVSSKGGGVEKEVSLEEELSLVELFVHHILEGQWDESLSVLHKIGLMDKKIMKSASLLILEQKFFEFWDEDKVLGALKTAREQVLPLLENDGKDDEPILLQQMGFFLGCNHEWLEKSLHEPGSKELELESRKRFLDELRKSKLESRQKLLGELCKLLFPTLMVSHRHACKFRNSSFEMPCHVEHHHGDGKIRDNATP